MSKTIDPTKRLFAGVTVEKNGCWIWKNQAYASFSLNGAKVGIHHASYMLFIGPIPDGKILRHTCDIARCVNPGHLIIGSRSDNMQDAILRGQISFSLGSKNGMSKLTRENVLLIRQSVKSSGELAKLLNVSQSTINHVRRKATWKEV